MLPMISFSTCIFVYADDHLQIFCILQFASIDLLVAASSNGSVTVYKHHRNSKVCNIADSYPSTIHVEILK